MEKINETPNAGNRHDVNAVKKYVDSRIKVLSYASPQVFGARLSRKQVFVAIKIRRVIEESHCFNDFYIQWSSLSAGQRS